MTEQNAFDHISNPGRAYSYWHDFAKDNLFGIEINDQIARVSKMNMIIHDDGHTNVISAGALERFNTIEKIHRIGYDVTGLEDSQNDLKKILAEYQTFKSAPLAYEGC